MNLKVLYCNSLVGTLHQDQEGRICFSYSREWPVFPNAFPLSQSLPLSGDYEQGTVDHRFFANLLPEAAARETICRGLGISRDNDFELLAAIGGECAGALQIVCEESDQPAEHGYEPISDSVLKKAVETHIPWNRLAGDRKLRLSLAGAQDKWPVYYDGEQFYWPVGGAPSSHILKFTSRDFKGLNWNEAYTSTIVRNLGLPAVEVSIGEGYSLTERYDRMKDENGTVTRLHQEDFCQALGYPFYRKYEADGGPTFRDCIELLKQTSISAAKDQRNLLHWQVLNLLLGNADGHAKNLSLLYTPNGPELSPFYDVTCTSIYPGITADLALSVGGNADPGQIRSRDWQSLADELGMRPGIMLKALHTYIDLLQANLSDYHKEFVRQHGSDPVLERINQAIRARLRRTERLLQE